MTMTIALDSTDRIVSIDEVPSGLLCMCRCLECQESLIARKGKHRIHHFSHVSQKVPCEVQPESFLHLYAKRVVREALGLHLPPQPGHVPNAEDQSSWWDFDSVREELWMGDFRPDLVAHLCDGPLLIEFACTSFVDEEKLARIEREGIRTVEVDLSGLEVTSSAAGLLELKKSILHRADIKQWLYLTLVCLGWSVVDSIAD
ncbi:competence protein CoiA family protein [Pseudomonas sp. 2FG]|uniref:competence protein CoiA family protein n=1 Tax=Pseudomonas sp. 2FG TaxID=2502191 RepID=UPI0010F8686E|nr:competence protein CoiA family protein [Pseudomonas sp. 2FG]